MIEPTLNNAFLSKLANTPQNNLASNLSTSNDFGDTFAQMLSSSMLTGSLFGGSSGSENSSGVSGMLMPLMMLLMEQILAQKTDLENDPTAPASLNGLAQTSARTGLDFYTNAALASVPSGRPVGGGLTQKYHNRHFGLDFGIPVGTDVKSTMSGKVVYAGWNNQGYGNLVIVENGPYQTYYAHLSSIPVNVGDQVSQGQVIGLSGNTGNSTGPHLHYEIRRDGAPIDPTSQTLSITKIA